MQWLTSAPATLAIIILLPLIPAFLLFKLLPNTAVVNGPLQGLRIDLSGAFAAYFALVALVLSTHSVWDPPPAYQVWTVSGRVTDPAGDPLQLNATNFFVFPQSLTAEDGYFTMDIPVKTGQGGALEYPTLTITNPKYFSASVTLNPGSPPKGVTFNALAHTIAIGDVQLQQIPPPPANEAAPLNGPASSTVPSSSSAGVNP